MRSLTRFSLVALVAVLLAFGLEARLPAQLPPAPRVVRLTPPEAQRPGEVSVAINPTNPEHVIAVLLQGGAVGGPRITNYAYTSQDGGLTWTGVPSGNPDGRVQGDDAVAFGPDGTAYHTYISFDGIRVARPLKAASGIFVQASRDGLTWAAPVPVVDHVNSVIPFEDKPWPGVDRVATSPHRGNVYVAWTRFDVYGSDSPDDRSHIMVSRSRDGGRTFEPPIEISDATGDAKDSDGTLEGVVPAVGPDGALYIAWAGPQGILVDKSTDGGYSFGTDVKVADQPEGWDLPVEGLERHNGMPVTGVDTSNGPHRGSVYVNWIDARNGDPDVFVAASGDGGQTWSAPVRVNDDPKGATQLFTWMAVDPADGSLNVVFHDRRGGSGTKTGVTVARSVDGGKTFVNYPLPMQAFDCCGDGFFGDYNGIDANGGRVVAAFPVLTADGTQIVQAAVLRFERGTTRLLP
ncbi:MAG: sialidase family protein [Vicinamibacterales bacterium]